MCLVPRTAPRFANATGIDNLFRAQWTDQIHEEWIRSLLEKRPDLTREQLEKTRALMNLHVRDCLVTGYEDLIDGLTLPDPDDRHVLAAAIKTKASVIVTFNLEDFPYNQLMKYGLEAQHPDEFIVHLFDLNTAAVCLAAKQQRAALRHPPMSSFEFLSTLANQHLSETVRRPHRFRDLI